VPRGKRLYELGSEPTLTRVGERKTTEHRTKGGHSKVKLAQTTIANVFDPKKKTWAKATVSIVSANKANRNYVRRNIMTKGAVIDTNIGKARVTNRPGQEGQINAILI
jgi:small subunit ribosomal protein S8e